MKIELTNYEIMNEEALEEYRKKESDFWKVDFQIEVNPDSVVLSDR